MARTRQAKAVASEAESASQRPKITRQSKATAPETKSASQRSKITRQSRAAASETESASQSPKVARQSKAAASKTESVDFNNEDYNVRSPKRTKLLTEYKGVINNAPVSPTLWACCQLADMDCLQVITKLDEAMIRVYEDSLATIAMKWTQRLRDSDLPGSEAASRPEGPKRRKLNSDGQSSVPNTLVGQYTQCKERDDHKCALTKMPYPQATYIFPYNMINPPPEADKTKASRYIPEFWGLLGLFWDEDRVMKWKRAIFPDSENPDVGAEGCFNLISLTPTAHDMWNRGLFALKPLKLSRNQKKLTVQFFWQVPGNHDIDGQIDLLTEPTSSKGLEIVANESNKHWLTRLENDGSTPRIRSGETFTFTTKDPKNLPLPSLELLEMQWVLHRLVGMCGAAEWPSWDMIEDDTIDGDGGWFIPDRTDYDMHNSSGRVREWVDTEAAGITPETSTATPGLCDGVSLNGPA